MLVETDDRQICDEIQIVDQYEQIDTENVLDIFGDLCIGDDCDTNCLNESFNGMYILNDEDTK